MKYILVTFYLTHIEGKETWLLYGHVSPSVNESLGEYHSQTEVMREAFKYGVPVMLGRSYEAVLEKLNA